MLDAALLVAIYIHSTISRIGLLVCHPDIISISAHLYNNKNIHNLGKFVVNVPAPTLRIPKTHLVLRFQHFFATRMATKKKNI